MHKKSVLDLGAGLGVTRNPDGRWQPKAAWMATYLDKVDYYRQGSAISDLRVLPQSLQEAVVCLEPVAEQEEFCRQIWRILKPGGFFLGRMSFAQDLKKHFESFLFFESIKEGGKPFNLVFTIK